MLYQRHCLVNIHEIPKKLLFHNEHLKIWNSYYHTTNFLYINAKLKDAKFQNTFGR